MAMEKAYTFSDTHIRPVTSLGYNPARREILLGCEDGIVKMLEGETGKVMNSISAHKGLVTDFVYWSEAKVVFSSGNDGYLIAWGSGGSVCDRLQIGEPIYSLTVNVRRKQLICGLHSCLRVYDLDEGKVSGHYVNLQVKAIARDHTDIVRCVVYQDARVYSAGYDQRLVIYESLYSGSLKPIVIIRAAHNAGITCLALVKDGENNTWCVTGSFDKVVKIWSSDGKLIHRLDGFTGMISGLCYVQRNKSIWVSGGAPAPFFFDPKSGDNISEFIGLSEPQDEIRSSLQLIKYFPESSQVVATTCRQNLVVWRYNSSGCITTLKCPTVVESIAYTKTAPILFFVGDGDGNVTKWEQMLTNHFIYSREILWLADAVKAQRRRRKDKEKLEIIRARKEREEEEALMQERRRTRQSLGHYAFSSPTHVESSKTGKPDRSIFKIVFIEDLSLIVAACEDSNIYVWGFDENAIEALRKMEPEVRLESIPKEYEILLGSKSVLLKEGRASKKNLDINTNRVAGYVCRHIFNEHHSCVTSLALVTRKDGWDGTYIVSAGWDRRICIWEMEEGVLKDTFRNQSSLESLNSDPSFISVASTAENVEIACDGIIHELSYSPSRNEIAYASSDKLVYIRKFSTDGAEMSLVNTLQGHEGEVLCVKWNAKLEKWITGSEDGTMRVWAGSGLNECEQVLSTQGLLSSMCIDVANGAIVIGVQHKLRVYEPKHFKLVQTNVGHTDVIRCILHIPERGQYISSSWDTTVRIWNAWKQSAPKVIRPKPQEEVGLTTEGPPTEEQNTDSNLSVSVGHDNSVAIDNTSVATIATPDRQPSAHSVVAEKQTEPE